MRGGEKGGRKGRRGEDVMRERGERDRKERARDKDKGEDKRESDGKL